MVNSSADMAMEDWPARDAVRVIAAGGAKAVSAHEAVTSMCPRGCVWGGLRRCNGILLTAESKGKWSFRPDLGGDPLFVEQGELPNLPLCGGGSLV